MSLNEWGWTDARAAQAANLARGIAIPARVTGQARDRWTLHTAQGAALGRRASPSAPAIAPVVGDWVMVEPGPMPDDPWTILDVLPRHSTLSRGSAGGGTTEQVLAANVDIVWIVHPLDIAADARRLERYLAVAWQSGAIPEVILTKADLAPDLDAALAAVLEIAVGVDVRTVSAEDEGSVHRLRTTLRPGKTVVLVGPSGAGKSTLINLLGDAERTETAPVRRFDRKGRHTTTRRELFRLPGGSLLIDTPGIRELRVWDLDEGLERAFPDIEELSRSCRFGDCLHEQEPGCAVLAAEAEGRLATERLTSFRKLRSEALHQATRSDPRARRAAVSEHKTAVKTMKYHHKLKGPA